VLTLFLKQFGSTQLQSEFNCGIPQANKDLEVLY